jgi:hypothetical protein
MSIIVAMDADIKRSYARTQTIWDAGMKSHMVSIILILNHNKSGYLNKI